MNSSYFRRTACLFLAMIVLVFVNTISAQEFRGTISGTVTDPNGAGLETIGSGGASLTWGAPGIAFLRSGTLWLVDPGRAVERQVGTENRLRGPIAWTRTNEVVATRVERPGDDETMQLVRVGLDGTVTALTPASGRYGRMTVSGATGKISPVNRWSRH